MVKEWGQVIAKYLLQVTEMFNIDKNASEAVASRPYFVYIAHFLCCKEKFRKRLSRIIEIAKLTLVDFELWTW